MHSKLTIVMFKAFDKQCKELFFDKTYEQIDTELKKICDTYVTLFIIETTQFNFLPLNILKK